MTKKQRIINYLIKHPTTSVKDVAAKFKVSPPYIYSVRKQAMHEAQEQIAIEMLGPQVEEPIKVKPFIESPRANDRQVGGDHYKSMGVQPWNVVDTWPIEQRIGYYRGGALKYIMRLGTKDESPIEAGKGLHYLEKLIEVLHEQRTDLDDK
jgi:hypothetical protein